jgi:hypothetical protein
LGVAILAFGYFFYQSVRGPMKWENEKTERYTKIKERLVEIRTAQTTYKAINGHYARTFQELMFFLNKGKLKRPNGFPVVPADSLFGKSYRVFSMPYIPFGGQKRFNMEVKVDADSTEYLEVSDPSPFDPDDPLSFGSLTESTLKASWEAEN